MNVNENSDVFWKAYQACVEENRIDPEHARFYIHWARTFLNHLPDKPLNQRSHAEIEAFLKELAGQPGIKDWQVNQSRYALRLLYEQFLPNFRPSAASAELSAAAASGRNAEMGTPLPEHQEPFRDEASPGEIERRHGVILQAMTTEIRARHYSYRTEQTYLDWARRFIAFHAKG